MKRLVFFDLDGTILDGKISCCNKYFAYLAKRNLITLQGYLGTISFPFRWALQYRSEVFVHDLAYFAGLKLTMILEEAKKFFSLSLAGTIRQGIVSYLSDHIKSGDYVVLLTGAPLFLADLCADSLGLERKQVAASLLDLVAGTFTAKPPKQFPFGKEKLRIAEKIAQEKRLPLSKAVAYGNSFSDRYLLREVGEAVAVTPSARLRYEAKKQGWAILDSKGKRIA